MTIRNAYPSDVSDDEWAFVAPYLTLMPEDDTLQSGGIAFGLPGGLEALENGLAPGTAFAAAQPFGKVDSLGHVAQFVKKAALGGDAKVDQGKCSTQT